MGHCVNWRKFMLEKFDHGKPKQVYDIVTGPSGVSGQAVQPVPLASLKLSMAVYGQKLDGRPSR